MVMIIVASLGAAVGSVARFLIQARFTAYAERTILGINWLAAFLAGIMVSLHLSPVLHTLMLVGLIGGFSTFSGPIIKLADSLGDASKRLRAIRDIVILFAGGIILFDLGYLLTAYVMGH
ncbi:CrcB family protein [Weissella ceti]|uniref:Fluoride-specific ion channel n=1 Tax=Weissella ceti TaxID=759620 RepID=A0ABT3E2S5_9LACO|nr:CrcB family protein [Weissella ceti]MCW0952645.1 CrcB family protein [Weissella ceti]QVK12350.1 CrcB family protein [Weissella ceti]